MQGGLPKFCDGPERLHIGNMDGFAIDLQDAVLAKFTQGPDHIFCGHPHIFGHLLPGEREIKFLR